MRKTKKTAIVAGTTVAVMGAGIAFAAWTSNGTGTGTATAGSAENLVVTGADVSSLFPTKEKVVNFSVKNQNTYAVALDSLATSVKSATGNAGCTTVNSAVSSAAGVIPANPRIGAGETITVPVTVAMGADSDNACQGVVFTIEGVATSHSVS